MDDEEQTRMSLFFVFLPIGTTATVTLLIREALNVIVGGFSIWLFWFLPPPTWCEPWHISNSVGCDLGSAGDAFITRSANVQ